MNCDRIKEHLPFIDDGSLDSNVEAFVREHLKNCPECRKEHDEIKNIKRIVQSAFTENIPDNAHAMLRNITSRIQSRKNTIEIYRRILPSAAAILITVMLGYFAFIPDRSGDLVPQNTLNAGITDEELFDYIAENHFDSYELYELVDEAEIIDEYDLRDALFHHEYFTVTVDDIIEALDYEEFNDLYVSAYN